MDQVPGVLIFDDQILGVCSAGFLRQGKYIFIEDKRKISTVGHALIFIPFAV
jgi:hypothetical protein